MFNLEKYSEVLGVIERVLSGIDDVTGHNIAKELSVIYLKNTYGIHMPGVVPRLDSLIDYTTKAVPNSLEIVAALLSVRESFTHHPQ